MHAGSGGTFSMTQPGLKPALSRAKSKVTRPELQIGGSKTDDLSFSCSGWSG
jgi:hypothetical protein